MIGKIIKNMRKSKNYSQIQLAKLSNLGRSTISDYERGKSQPDFSTIELIANNCGYEIVFKNKNSKEEYTSKNIERKML